MKKLFFLLFAIILLASCNTEVCPAYSDSANNVKSSLFQSGSYRADGINKVYRDSYSYRKK
ncbi:MAG: lipoprotein [Bacteroidia bacterium]|nr:lipoprotein [Bacteroidia bacterium]